MPEHSDYTPAPWAADSFVSARATYDTHVGRSYDDAVKKGITATDLVPASISTTARAPVVIFVDQTGSMGAWPATIFSKLGYLDHEAKFYFDDDYAIAFGAFGDANHNEDYPLQIRPFAKEDELQTRLKELVIEGGGGGTMSESSELCALYADNNIEMPNAIRPILILITDEKCYETVNIDQAKQWAKVDLHQRITTKDLFESLKSKFSVYLIRKPYSNSKSNDEDSRDRDIRLSWEKLLGADRIAYLPDASRVVDVIFGIFAQETGKVNEYRKELADRQLKDAGGDKKVETALKALLTIHSAHDAQTKKRIAGPAATKTEPGKTGTESVTRRDPNVTTKRSKSLLD
jgi:hypothetical protein